MYPNLLHGCDFLFDESLTSLRREDTTRGCILVIVRAILCYQLFLILIFFCQAENKSSAWKAYMEEVKKYKEMTCSEDGDRVCPLVK